MTVYLIAQLTINDRERYRRYAEGFVEIFAKYGGKLLSVDEEPEVLEGDWPYARTVLLSLPSKEQAEAWYNSAEYQALAQHRLAASSTNLVMIKAREPG